MMNDSGIFIVKHEILQHALILPIPCPTPHLKISYHIELIRLLNLNIEEIQDYELSELVDLKYIFVVHIRIIQKRNFVLK